MKRILFLFVALTALLTACAPNSTVELNKVGTEIQFTLPGENPAINTAGANGQVAGFGTGLWHGLVALITLFVSFFNPAVQMYEVHNDGGWYNLGFLIGAIFLSGFFGFLGGRR